MKSRKWLWPGLGALCALAVLVAWLARPEDDLGGMLQLRPQVDAPHSRETGATFHQLDSQQTAALSFSQPPGEVLASIPGRKTNSSGNTWIVLPSGREATFFERPKPWDGATCMVILYADHRTWYQKAWAAFKSRLGL